MFGSIMQVNMMFKRIVFLFLVMKSVLVISTNTSEVDNVTEYINYKIEFPCDVEISFAKDNCTGTTPSDKNVSTYYKFVKTLKNYIRGLESSYNDTHYNICQNVEKMNATMEYLNKQNFCEIPLTMVDQDVSESSTNMRQITKWMLWLAEVEKKVGSSEELGEKFNFIANYSKKTACHEEYGLCIEGSDVHDVIDCILPPVLANSDPQDLIPISCHVLDHIHKHTLILKRSIRSQIRQAFKNKKCKKGGKRGRKCKKNRKNRKNRKQRCKKTRRNGKDGKRRRMCKRKNGTKRGCRNCKNKKE